MYENLHDRANNNKEEAISAAGSHCVRNRCGILGNIQMAVYCNNFNLLIIKMKINVHRRSVYAMRSPGHINYGHQPIRVVWAA